MEPRLPRIPAALLDGSVSIITYVISPDMSMVSRLMENEADGGLCPSCHMPFDNGKQRRLLDSCGHERCYSCLFRQEECPVCRTQGNFRDQENLYTSMKNLRCGRSPSLPRGVSPVDPDCLYGSVSVLPGGRRGQATPPQGRRTSVLASPQQPGRRTWLQRHNRRPQTVSVDDSTLSGETRNINLAAAELTLLTLSITNTEPSTAPQWSSARPHANLPCGFLGSRYISKRVIM